METINWKSLGVFTDDQAIYEVLGLYFASLAGFLAIYYLTKMIFPKFLMAVFGPENAYFTLSEASKREYCSRILGEIHATIVSPLATYACFYSCDDPTQSIFSSDECLMKP